MYSLVKFIYDALANTNENSDTNMLKLDKQYEKLNKQCEIYDETHEKNNTNIEDIEESDCFTQEGVITSLESFNGIINNNICFELSAAEDLRGQLSVGCKVTYLAHKNPDDDLLKVIKVISINSQVWEKPSNNQVILFILLMLFYNY